MKAGDFLTKAHDLMAERAVTFDNSEGERSMGAAVNAFNAITGKDLTEAEGWLLLQVLKDCRQWQTETYHADSAEDCVAYAALKAEALSGLGNDTLEKNCCTCGRAVNHACNSELEPRIYPQCWTSK